MDKVVIPADQLGPKVLEDLFNSMPPTRLGIAIGVANETSYKWSGTNAFFFSGKPGRNTIPEFLEKDHAALFSATKRTGRTSGTVGVITFFIPDDNMTVAVMFSVPFYRLAYSNWWNAKVYRNKKEADKDMWSQMYYQEPFEGDNGWHQKEIGEGYNVKGIMTSSSRCTLQLKIWKEADKGMSSQTKPKPLPTVTHRNSCFERLIERVVSSFRHRKIVPSSLPKAN